MTSIKKNFAYNIFYQILAIILPLVTAPYISRVLGAEGVGIYAYTSAVASYFLLFTMLGISNHGNRTIAATVKSKEELGYCFVNNYIIQLTIGTITVIAYLCYTLMFAKSYEQYAFIQTLLVLSGVFDINWFFWGLEKFKLTVIRNSICKGLSVICIFVFVNTQSDLWKYILIMSLTMLISQLLLWNFLFKEIKFCRPNWIQVKRNIKPIVVLFLPILSYSLYRIMDKIMIGSFASMTEVGYYVNAEKILNIPIGVITALGNVMLPRISNLMSNGVLETQYKYFKTSILFVSIFAGAFCFGIASIADIFVSLYFGAEFEKTGKILEMIIFSALISGWANVIRTQILLPRRMDNIYVLSMLVASAVNFILNLIFIPRYGALGAVIGTVAAELIVLFIQGISVRADIDWKEICKMNYPYIITGLFMFIFVKMIDITLVYSEIVKILIEILLGGLFYIAVTGVICVVQKNEIYAIITNKIWRRNNT